MNRASTRVFPALALLGVALAWTAAPGQAKKPAPKKDAPTVILSNPLGVIPGKPTKILLRGLKLDTATALRFSDPKATAKILSKAKVGMNPKVPPAKGGDSQVVAEVTLPAGAGKEPVTFAVVTPAGASPPHRLLVETALPVIREKEPNDGFRQDQPIRVPQVVDGDIGRPQDVDVFRIEGKAGQKLSAEVLAARYGSALDSLLTLYDARGHQLAASDDTEGSTDSRLEVTLPADGPYYLSVMDANDLGGPTHPYRLVVRAGK